MQRKYSPHHYTTITSLNHWYKAGWIHAFMCLRQIMTLLSECRSWNQDIFPIFYCPIQFPVLNWKESHPVWSSCCPSASRFDVLCLFRNYILHTLVVMRGYLCYCSIITSQSAHSPLTSTWYFRPHSCHSLDIFYLILYLSYIISYIIFSKGLFAFFESTLEIRQEIIG